MVIPLWLWRFCRPNNFYRCEEGFFWHKENKTDSYKDPRTFLAVGESLKAYHPSAEQYLARTSDTYPWAQTWLQFGKEYHAPSLDEVIDLIKNKMFMKPRECFANALEFGIALSDEDPEVSVLYVEGLALGPTGVHIHAWLEINGKTVDLTWRDSFLCSYFGVGFPVTVVEKIASKTKWYGLLPNWELSKEYIEEALATIA
jgi:hypothetical protein